MKIKTDMWKTHEQTKSSYAGYVGTTIGISIMSIFTSIIEKAWITTTIILFLTIFSIIIKKSYQKHTQEEEITKEQGAK